MKKRLAFFGLIAFVLWFAAELWGPVYWHQYVIKDFDPSKPLSFELMPNPTGYGPIDPHGEDYMERRWPRSQTYIRMSHSS